MFLPFFVANRIDFFLRLATLFWVQSLLANGQDPLNQGQKMNYYEQCKSDGIKLELQPHRGTSWKVFKGKRYYFNFPLTKKGYQQALQAWYLTKAEIDNTRPNADLYHHHIDLFSEVLTYWDSFGTPTGERSLKKQVVKFIAFLKAELLKPTLQKPIPWKSPKEFYSAFFTTISEHVFFCTSAEYKLPDK